MQSSSNRSVVVIAALLTLLVLGGSTFGLALHRGWLRTASDTPSPETVSDRADASRPSTDLAAAPRTFTQSAAPASAASQDEVAAYRQKLDEAYRALDEAYAQIRVLQTARPKLAVDRGEDNRFTEHDDRDRHRERRSNRDSDDE
jgi:hypothetical protein